MKSLSRRLSGIAPSGVRELFEIANRYPDVANLTLGEPDVATPAYIRAAACRALDEGFTHYTSNLGIPELREAIAERYRRDYGSSVDPADVMVTQGGTQAILYAMSTIMDEGDEVLLPTPAFVGYAGAASLIGVRVLEVEAGEDDGFVPTAESLGKALRERTKAIIINSPSNPTGAVYGRRSLEEIVDFAIEHDLYLISDEVYEKFVFDGGFVSLTSFDDEVRARTIVVNSFSKTYAMTGWRIGYMLLPKGVVDLAIRYQMYDAVCPSSVAQRAALAALLGPQDFTANYVSEISKRLGYAHQRLSEMDGVSVVKPRGAFYVFPRIGLDMPSAELAKGLIEEERVAMVPGSTFGKGGEGHLRISLAADMGTIERGLDGLGRFISRHANG